MWTACVQREIECTELSLIKEALIIMYNFISIFVYAACEIKMY